MRSNRAVTSVLPPKVTAQFPSPEHAPRQPTKCESAPCIARNTTRVPRANVAEHFVPQSMPPGSLVTVPSPSPDLVTRKVSCFTRKTAETLLESMSGMNAQVSPLHAPPQWSNS